MPSNLVDMAAMGSAMARVLFGLDRPTVGLLNIGVEEVKGLEEVREAGRILRDGQWPQFEYVGFVEGDDIGKGTVDVVVTEGFAGNIALKTAEGTARQIGQLLKREMDRSLIRKLGYLLARGAFRALSEKMDPRKSNGGVFLGLNGIVIKSHGGTDAEGFACAVDIGYDMVRHELLAKIGRRPHAPSARGGATAVPSGEQPRDHAAVGRPGLRQLSAAPRPHQCRAVADGRYLRRMDRAAHRHSRAPHRGGRRNDRPIWRSPRRARRWPPPGSMRSRSI